MDVIKEIEFEGMKDSVPKIEVGNTVKVHVRIKEGNKSRVQAFEGTIIAIKGSGINKSFTVRRISYGVGVEKTFLIHSPLVEKIELVRVGKVRRAKLYYLRDRVGKKAKIKEKIGARLENEMIDIKGKLFIPETEAEEDVNEVVTEEEIKEIEEKENAENTENIENTENTEKTETVENEEKGEVNE